MRFNVAVILRGGVVGVLLLCKLSHKAISIDFDQPNDNGGNYFVIDADSLR